MSNLTLITALGTDANLVLELLDFFNGGEQFIYNEESEQIRQGFNGRQLQRLYLLCTEDERVQETLKDVRRALASEYSEVDLDIIHLPFSDLRSSQDDNQLKETRKMTDSLYTRLVGYDGIAMFATPLVGQARKDDTLSRFWANRG